jgi:hypothetical protein
MVSVVVGLQHLQVLSGLFGCHVAVSATPQAPRHLVSPWIFSLLVQEMMPRLCVFVIFNISMVLSAATRPDLALHSNFLQYPQQGPQVLSHCSLVGG